ncbi:MAG: hypothetical protein H0V17_35560 [Deltaproteobacteria bacterium]|nr:hypothetical protein [Deltaproteobacteria bacterium]
MGTLTILTVLAATATTAFADHGTARYGADEAWRTSPSSLPQNRQPQTEERYQQRNELAEVHLDAFRQRAYVQLPRYAGALDYLELRAGRTPFTLRDVEVRFADGTSLHTGSRGLVEAHEGRVIDLPRGSAKVIAVIPHYQTASFRAPAKLEVFGVPVHRGWQAMR